MRQDRNQSEYGIGTMSELDEDYNLVHEALSEAIIAELDGRIGTSLQKLHPHMRQCHVGELRRRDKSYGPRRLYRLAKSLGIEVEITIRKPAASVAA